MGKVSDGIVTTVDLISAMEEIRRGEGEMIIARLYMNESPLASYIDALASTLTSHVPSEDRMMAVTDAMERILVIVRAMELAQHRIWQDLIPPMSPLAKTMGFGQKNMDKNR